MGLKLAFLSWWTPKFIISSQLDAVSTATTKALKDVLFAQASSASTKVEIDDGESLGSLDDKRAAMTRQHTILVDALVEVLGREMAVKMGREALFKVGKQLGTQNRVKLGVGDSEGDLVKAARIMYRVLGIEFKVEWLGPEQAKLTVKRCSLARNYSELTCEVLSATDEGVVNGLNPNMHMKFEERITGGYKVCTAKIERSRQK